MPSLPEGLLVELVTPLTPMGSLDRTALARLLDRVVPVAAALVAGSPGVGEALELPHFLRLELFASLLDLVPPDLPLLFGIPGATPEETRQLALQLEAETARQPEARPIFWLDLPLWWHSNRGLPQTYQQLSGQLRHPLILMNHPHLVRGKANPLKHVNIRTAVLKKITAAPGVRGLIYRGEIRRFLHYYAAVAMRPDFMLYEADERRFLTRPGARGLVSAGAQLFPEVWLQVIQSCLYPGEHPGTAQTRHLIWEWSQLLLELHDLYQLHPAALIKLGLQRLGVLEFSSQWPATPSFPAHLGERFLQVLDRAINFGSGG